MYQFNSIQQALNYVFEGCNVTTINLPNSPHPWFLVDQIRIAVGFKGDNSNFTRFMEHRDEYLAVLTLPEMAANLAPVNFTGASSQGNYGGIRQFMIVSLPGLFELLRHVSAKTSPRVSNFWYWMNNTVLPTLYYNPQLVEQINDLSIQNQDLTIERNIFRDVAKSSMSELYANRRYINNLREELSASEEDNAYLNKRINNLQDELEQYENSDPYDIRWFD